MKKIILLAAFVCIFIQAKAQHSTDNSKGKLINNIVLINRSPWQVVMNRQGEILSKLSHKPRYLDGYEEKNDESSYANRQSNNYTTPNYSVLEEHPPKKFKNSSFVPVSEREIEVNFKMGSATIVEGQIAQLDIIAQNLKDNPNKKFKIFSFNNEPVSKAYILAKRRLDVVLKYLSIKGINTDKRLIQGNENIRGQNNKIVFLPVN